MDYVDDQRTLKMTDANGQTNVMEANKTWENSNNLQFYLRWNNFQTNLTKVFDQLLQNESFVDVTLACDGHSIKAHKIVLSACSPYFQSLFSQNPCQHPIVIMRDVTWPQLKAIVEFIYKGEISVAQEQLAPLLMVAEMLKIRGLSEVSTDQETAVIDSNPITIINEKVCSDLPNCDSESSKIKPTKRKSCDNSETTSTYVTLPSVDTQSLSPRIINDKSATTLQTLTNVPFLSYTSRSSDMPSNKSTKCSDEPPIKQIKSRISSISNNADISPARFSNKANTWTQDKLQDAIQAVVTQKMRFTQASVTYGIPKGTLYDNILGKTKRMVVLDEAGLSNEEENKVLEFCCDVSVSPYNRRTNKSLINVLEFVEKLRRARDPDFAFSGLAGFRWWWAFCKKYSIVSLYYDNKNAVNTLKVEKESEAII